MDIRKDFLYSVKEASDFTKWSVRKLQRYAKKNDFRKIDNRYLFSGHHIEEILLSKIGIDVNDTTTTENDTGGYDTNVKPLSVIEILENEIKNLRDERDYLKEKYETDITELRKQVANEIPHKQKLKEAIQLITLEAMEQNVQHKIFTEEEYTDIIGTISEVDFQKEQVNYLRKRVERQDEILNELVRQSGEAIAEKRESNFIKAKEKGFDKE